MPGMTLRGDRLLRYVSAFCPHCHPEDPDRPLAEVRRLAGYLAEEEGQVWLVRGCPEHGKVRTLYDESPEILAWLEQWTAPTKRHVPDVPGNFDPIPQAYLRGLGEMQTQHTCILWRTSTAPAISAARTASRQLSRARAAPCRSRGAGGHRHPPLARERGGSTC